MQEEWFLYIFNLYLNDVYRLAFSYTHNRADSDDITQKVFLKYYKNINKVSKNEVEIKKWLTTITINECKDFFKAFWHRRVISIEEKDYGTNFDFNIDNNLSNSLNKLSKKYRIIFHLYYYYGYSTREIANMMKLSEATVRQRLTRGREKLKMEEEKSEKV